MGLSYSYGAEKNQVAVKIHKHSEKRSAFALQRVPTGSPGGIPIEYVNG